MSDVKEILANTDGQVPSDDVKETATLQRAEDNGQGFINIGGTFNGHYSKCKVKEFRYTGNPEISMDASVNEFFEKNPGQLVVACQPTTFGVLVFYTKTLTDQEIGVLQRYHEEIEKKLALEAEAEEAAKVKAEEEEQARRQEARKLIEKGKYCEDNHAAIIEENRKLKKGK